MSCDHVSLHSLDVHWYVILNICYNIQCYCTFLLIGLLKSKKIRFIKITPTHPLPVFHVFYHLMSHSYAFAQKLLLQSGILHLMMDEIEVLTLTPTFDKVNRINVLLRIIDNGGVIFSFRVPLGLCMYA